MKKLFLLFVLLFNINLFSQVLVFKANYVEIVNLKNDASNIFDVNIKIKMHEDNVYFSSGKMFTVISEIREEQNILYCTAIDEDGKKCRIFVDIQSSNKILFALEYKDFMFIYHCILSK